MSGVASERAAIVAWLRKRRDVLSDLSRESVDDGHDEAARQIYIESHAIDEAADYIEAGKHNQDTKGSA
jgi:anti-sigma factor RsiW